MFDDNKLSQKISNNNMLKRLQDAYRWQKGDDPMSYVDIRILEKKGLVYVYRDHNTLANYEVGGEIIQRPRIKGLTLMWRGRILLGLEQEKRPLWDLD